MTSFNELQAKCEVCGWRGPVVAVEHVMYNPLNEGYARRLEEHDAFIAGGMPCPECGGTFFTEENTPGD